MEYGFGGKELNEDLGLNWMDFGGRWYMADLCRWGQVDPLAEQGYSRTPYHYVRNNPLAFVDPTGLGEDPAPLPGATVYSEENANRKQRKEAYDEWQRERDREYGLSSEREKINVMLVSSSRDKTLELSTKDAMETTNLTVLEVTSTSDAVKKLKKLLGDDKEIGNLFVNSHGAYDNSWPGAYRFKIGQTKYSTESGVLNAKNLKEIGRLMASDGKFILMGCHCGSAYNGGEEVVKAIARVTGTTVYANKSWSLASTIGNTFGKPPWGLIPYYQTDRSIPGETYTYEARKYAFDHQGQWIKVKYSGGKYNIQTIYGVHFTRRGSIRYTNGATDIRLRAPH